MKERTKNILPQKTVERLSKYRRILNKYRNLEEPHIFSHDLARMLNITPEQVRRDIMLIGFTGNHRKGYNVKELVDLIGKKIDKEDGLNIALIGIGNLGRAVTSYISKAETKLNIVAAFDTDPNKIGTKTAGVTCHGLADIEKIVEKHHIEIAVLTVPPEFARQVADILVESGIKGILNFTSIHIDVSSNVYIKDYDIITSLEEIGFFVSNNKS